MKSIKWKINCIMVSVILTICLVLGVSTCFLNYQSTMSSLKKSMMETAVVAADRIHYELIAYQNVAKEVGSTSSLADTKVTTKEKEEIIAQRAKEYGFERGNMVGLNGVSPFDGNNYSDRSYIQKALKGEANISDPVISKVTGKLTFLIAAPLWQDGVPNTKIIGAVYFVPTETFLNDIVKSIQVGDTGSAYMLNKEGLTIAHPNAEIVGKENTLNDAKTNPSLKDIAAIEQRMVNGESDFASYSYGGVNKIMTFAPIPDTNGWSLGITAARDEFIAGLLLSIFIVIGMIILFTIIGIVVSISFASAISKPIQACAFRLRTLSQGDLHSPIPTTKSKDEIGILMSSLNDLTQELTFYIDDIGMHLGEISHGNLTAQLERDYKGDFSGLADSIRTILNSLRTAMTTINQNADQVAVGANQVSAGAQALSQGATEQASAVEELAATIGDISSQVSQNAGNANDAREKAIQAGSDIEACNLRMSEMSDAIQDISQRSKQIGNIIKTIEDIAFQTNILALNAAVEAARAGAAGKGFAVVADEVRALAGKSAEAAKNTTALIEGSIHAVENGTRIATDTANAMSAVVAVAGGLVSAMEGITSASHRQSDAIQQINLGIDQIASVVQTTSATSEQSAASSSELSMQAQTLKALVSKFRLDANAAQSAPALTDFSGANHF